MEIYLAHRNTKNATLEQRISGVKILDVTSKGPAPLIKFSPFYPHGDIPIPLSPGRTSESVEGIWQGLKVFKNADIDENLFTVRNMRNLKRTEKRYGKTLGHRAGTESRLLLPYLEARWAIYLPAYLWVLNNKLQEEVGDLQELSRHNPIVLLDYETNADIANIEKPISHAALMRAYLLNDWPQRKEAGDDTG